jgi:hypothetical protein
VSRRTCLLSIVAAFLTASCAPRLATLPASGGRSFPDYAAAHTQAIAACADVRTLAAILAISGRAGGNRLRATLDAGFERPGKVRLELPAPGKPIFTYVATGDQASLALPREGRILRNAPPAATLEALAGVAVDPDDLRTLVTGCGFGTEQPESGRAFDRGWATTEVAGATTWLQQVNGTWRIVAASRGTIEARYYDFVNGRPSTIRLRARSAGEPLLADLTIRLSQVDVNETIDPAAFTIENDPGAKPMTLDELRQAGPLGR